MRVQLTGLVLLALASAPAAQEQGSAPPAAPAQPEAPAQPAEKSPFDLFKRQQPLIQPNDLRVFPPNAVRAYQTDERPSPPPAHCFTMRIVPADPSIDPKFVRPIPETDIKYSGRVIPLPGPACR